MTTDSKKNSDSNLKPKFLSIQDIKNQFQNLGLKQIPKILAVSKFQSSEKILKMHQEQNQNDFGENYVQEAVKKIEFFNNPSFHWHFIGHLQKNKVKNILGMFDLIHSIDSLELATVLNNKINDNPSKQNSTVQNILIEINLANEASKGGFSKHGLDQAIDTISKLNHIKLCGLMTMPPLFEDPEKSRPYFAELKNLQQKYVQQIPSCTELSMGTSSDYLIAAQEGATIVRLGTLIFGEREKPNKS